MLGVYSSTCFSCNTGLDLSLNDEPVVLSALMILNYFLLLNWSSWCSLRVSIFWIWIYFTYVTLYFFNCLISNVKIVIDTHWSHMILIEKQVFLVVTLKRCRQQLIIWILSEWLSFFSFFIHFNIITVYCPLILFPEVMSIIWILKCMSLIYVSWYNISEWWSGCIIIVELRIFIIELRRWAWSIKWYWKHWAFSTLLLPNRIWSYLSL